MINLDSVRPQYKAGGPKKKVVNQYYPENLISATKRVISEKLERQNGVVQNYIPYPLRQSPIYNYHTTYDAIPWSKGTPQRKLYTDWVASGKPHKNGLAEYNGRTLVAMTNKYGDVGDDVDIILNSGDTIKATIADIKNKKDANYTPYGHQYKEGTSILEFENHGNEPTDLGSWHRKKIYKVNNLTKTHHP